MVLKVNYEEEIIWDFNVPRHLTFTVKMVSGCSLCEMDGLREWISPFVVARVPFDKMKLLIKENFNIDTITEHDFKEHLNHVKALVSSDEQMKVKIAEDIKLIREAYGEDVNESYVIRDAIRGLQARKLYLEKTGDYGREYTDVLDKLNKFLTLRLKLKGELKEDRISFNLSDLVRIGGVPEGEERSEIREPTINGNEEKVPKQENNSS